MKIHILIALSTGAMLHKSGATPLDLDAASSLLLDVLDICTTVANNLSAEVEARERLKINRDLLLGPFPLLHVSWLEHPAVSLPVQIHHVQTAPVLYGGIDAHPQGSAGPASSFPRSWRWPFQDPPC